MRTALHRGMSLDLSEAPRAERVASGSLPEGGNNLPWSPVGTNEIGNSTVPTGLAPAVFDSDSALKRRASLCPG